jgi:hypothetical protein
MLRNVDSTTDMVISSQQKPLRRTLRSRENGRLVYFQRSSTAQRLLNTAGRA